MRQAVVLILIQRYEGTLRYRAFRSYDHYTEECPKMFFFVRREFPVLPVGDRTEKG
jgi:hypothetical protein